MKNKKFGVFGYNSGYSDRRMGFTLIELLIVIAIIAIIAAVAFVALDPLTRFRDSRDSQRWADINAILTAIKVDQVDNGGSFVAAVSGTTAATEYLIGTDTSSCHTYTCDTAIAATADCVDLSALVTEGYLGSIPLSPNGAGTWTAGHTGYTLTRTATNALTIEACESENAAANSIRVTR
jgi:prepilin-type N-terminal cleavage/methylation domain-containing protein